MLAALLLSTQTPKVAVPAVGAKAELRLTVDRAVVGKDEDPGYHATIRNTGRTPLRLLEPQDGSEIGMRNPSVNWVLPDLRDPEIYARCGNANPIEAQDFFTLAPGQTREIGTGWSGMAQLSPGANRVRTTYDISPTRADRGFSGIVSIDGKPTPEETRVARLYAELTPVRLTSNVVRVTLKAAP